jgi:SAM-dependent methyltransferase
LGRPIEIVDVGSGYGDLLREIAKWAQRRRVDVSLTGVDRNPWARRAALEATPSELDIEWVTADAFSHTPSRDIDIVVSSCFTHHLSDARVVGFLQWMEANADLGWFVNDLHRHPLPYHVFEWVSEFARFHHFVRHDGPVSIARAFVAADWHRMLSAAGIAKTEADVQWRFPFRLTVARCKELQP